MTKRNIHSTPFDEGTLLKLEIFEKYLNEWIPVFFNYPKNLSINIADFFAGKGRDSVGKRGSPLIIIESLLKCKNIIREKNLKIKVLLNESSKKKYDKLKSEIEGYNGIPFECVVENKKFVEIFNKYYSNFESSANFIFLDQNGIKEITEGIFAKLINLKITDFLFFISSSFLRRFSDIPEFKRYLSINNISFNYNNYYQCHRDVYLFYKSLIPVNKEYYLAPFSFKKGSNIYGLIFGSNHTYGIEKFLRICWGIDSQRGEANFDIDSERINQSAPSLFPELDIPKKLKLFEKDLNDFILQYNEIPLIEVYKFGLDRGFLPKYVNKVLKSMKDVIEINGKTTSQKIHKVENYVKIKNLKWLNQRSNGLK